MKRFLCVVLMVILCCSSVSALAELDEHGIPVVKWEFPVALSYLQSKYVLLVNENNPLDESFEPDPLVKAKDIKQATNASVYMEEKALDAVKEMFKAASLVTEYTYVDAKGKTKKAEFPSGMKLFLKSGYRSYGTQATVYDNYLDRNNNKDDGYVAKPGTSEHQTGLCADILNKEYKERPGMTQDFKWTPEAQWMKENCANFGLILRYPEGTEDETGIVFEPWHFRYVGLDAAAYIMGRGVTLETFTADVQAAIQEFVMAGGEINEWIEYEESRLNAAPESFVLNEYDEEGDAEVSLFF